MIRFRSVLLALLAIAMVAFLGAGLNKLILALCIIGWVGYARLIRGQVLKVREYDFVQAIARREIGAILASGLGSYCWNVGASRLGVAVDTLDAKRKALNEEIGAYTQHKTSAEWIDRLNAAGVPCGPIYKINEVFEDPQVRHLGMAAKVHSPKLGDIGLFEFFRAADSIRAGAEAAEGMTR